MKQQFDTCSLLWVVTGDFNDISSIDERKNVGSIIQPVPGSSQTSGVIANFLTLVLLVPSLHGLGNETDELFFENGLIEPFRMSKLNNYF